MDEAIFEQIPQTIIQVLNLLRLRRYRWVIGEAQYTLVLAGPVISTLLFINFIVGHLRVWGCPAMQDLLMLRGKAVQEEEEQELSPVRSPGIATNTTEVVSAITRATGQPRDRSALDSVLDDAEVVVVTGACVPPAALSL